jgi:hypothetical protein
MANVAALALFAACVHALHALRSDTCGVLPTKSDRRGKKLGLRPALRT